MDLLNSARVRKISELAQSVCEDSQRHPGAGARLGLSARELERYSLVEAITGQLDPLGSASDSSSFERECSAELGRRFAIPPDCVAVPLDVLESRNLSYLAGVSTPNELPFVETLRQRSVVFQLGARHLTGLKDSVAIPRQVTDQTMQWLSSTSSASASDASLGQLSATPRRGVVISDVSEKLLAQSSAERIIQEGLASVLATGVDAAVLNGAGGAEPLGVLQTPGIGTVSGTSLAYAGLVLAQKTVADSNSIVNPDSLGYVTTPAVAELLKGRQRFTGSDSSLWKGALHEGEIEGVQALSTKQMLASTALYGDWATVYICEWGPLLLSADRGGTRFNQGLVGLRAQWFVDVICTSPTSFVKITAIT